MDRELSSGGQPASFQVRRQLQGLVKDTSLCGQNETRAGVLGGTVGDSFAGLSETRKTVFKKEKNICLKEKNAFLTQAKCSSDFVSRQSYCAAVRTLCL